ncbi:DUF6366 family protein [Macrococcus animalis]|uniref:DUF6366 family protein n=1 Tax=Macrococcus animalis TaxID=3395467 RepID=UPI0039BE25BC
MHEELNDSNLGNLKDHTNNTQLNNTVGSMSNKSLGILIIVLILIAVIGWLIVN